MERIRVLLADDHPAFRAGVKAALISTEGIDVVGEAENGKEALEMTRSLRPDVLLLDMEMPLVDGLSVAKELFQENLETKILPLSGYSDPEYIFGVLNNGASGYCMKDESLRIIVEAVISLTKGKVYMSPLVAMEVVRHQKREWEKGKEIDATYQRLANMGVTPNLLRILKLLAEGHNNEEIGELINRSEHTVRNHVARLQVLVDISWRPALVSWAWTEGIMALDADFYEQKYKGLRIST